MERRYYPVTLQQPAKPNWFPLVLVILGAWLWFQWSNQQWPFEQSEVVIVEPEDKPEPVDKVKLSDTYVVRVFESKASENPAWLVKQMQDDQFWLKWLRSDQQIGLHTFDAYFDGKPNPQAESFVREAKNHGIDPPFWMHVSSGTVLSITPFSESLKSEDWKKIIERVAK